jgi:hypothetical protein
MPPPRTQLTVAEAAERLDGILSKRAIIRGINSGAIPATKLPGLTGAFLIEEAVITDLLEQATLATADAVRREARRILRAARTANTAA